jgi:hypothetical protein
MMTHCYIPTYGYFVNSDMLSVLLCLLIETPNFNNAAMSGLDGKKPPLVRPIPKPKSLYVSDCPPTPGPEPLTKHQQEAFQRHTQLMQNQSFAVTLQKMFSSQAMTPGCNPNESRTFTEQDIRKAMEEEENKKKKTAQ